MASKSEMIQEQITIINKLLKKPENKLCADCKRPSPSWASTNLGIFVCIVCSGCHREIGVHITKIKSYNLDLWPKELLRNFAKITNAYWEKNLKNFDYKVIQNDNYRLQDFIRDKYERKKWIDKKKKDPMTLIIQGENDSEEEEDADDADDYDEESEEEEEVKDKGKGKDKKKEKSKGKAKDDDDDDEFAEVIEEDNKPNNSNLLVDFGTGAHVNSNVNNGSQQINNIIVINNNNNNAQSIGGVGNNANLLDVFSIETQEDLQKKKLENSLQQAYNNPSGNNQSHFGQQQQNPFGSYGQTKQQTSYMVNTNNIANNGLGMGFGNNNMSNYANNMNMRNYNSGISMGMPMNNNMGMGMNNMNNAFGMNMGMGMSNMSMNNMGIGNINMSMGTGLHNNYNTKPGGINLNSNQPVFDMELYNKTKTQSESKPSYSGMSTYSNRHHKDNDPFKNLVDFK